MKTKPPYLKTYHPTRGEMTWSEELEDYVDGEGEPLHRASGDSGQGLGIEGQESGVGGQKSVKNETPEGKFNRKK